MQDAFDSDIPPFPVAVAAPELLQISTSGSLGGGGGGATSDADQSPLFVYDQIMPYYN